jgi:hypothetical protein
VQEGQHVNVKIIHINNQRRRLGLSVRQAEESATPQSMQSFGDQDEYGSFSGQDFGDYSSTDTAQGEPASALSPRQEDTGPIGEEAEIPAPEPGPEASVTSDNGNNTSNGDAPADGISIEATEATPHNEHEGTEVASTASQRSANE